VATAEASTQTAAGTAAAGPLAAAMPAPAAASPAPATAAAPPAFPREAWVVLGVLGAAFVALFYRWIWNQHRHSAGSLEDWGHAYVIPGISGYLLWQHRAALARIRPAAFWPGLIPLVLGIVCYFFFTVIPAVANHMLQGFSMILALAGTVLLVGGPRIFRYAFLPLAYLVFAVTLAERIMIDITFQLQLLASQGAWLMLRLIGLPGNWFLVDVEGNTLTVIHRGTTFPLNVAEACSGMRMVIAFFALAGAVALFACRHWWQRIALLLLAAPVALFMNVVRVTLLGLLAMVNPRLIQGDAHILIGTLLLLPALGLFLAAVWALNKAVIDLPATGGKPGFDEGDDVGAPA